MMRIEEDDGEDVSTDDPTASSEVSDVGVSSSSDGAYRESHKKVATKKRTQKGANKEKPQTNSSSRQPSKSQDSVKDDLALQVKEYILRNNRPYGANDLVVSFRNSISKSAMLKILDGLEKSGEIFSKSFGKTTLYCARQDSYGVDQSELEKYDEEIMKFKEEIRLRKEELAKLNERLVELTSYPDDASLAKDIENVSNKRELNNVKLEELKNGRRTVPKEEMESIDSQLKMASVACKKRRRILKDMVDAVLDGTGESKSSFLGSLGIDIDII